MTNIYQRQILHVADSSDLIHMTNIATVHLNNDLVPLKHCIFHGTKSSAGLNQHHTIFVSGSEKVIVSFSNHLPQTLCSNDDKKVVSTNSKFC